MRPQQNRRIRGRSNNNRRGPNPLTRNYESNGPDVKIRGNAQHIADKYTALARDAQASGDRIIAENYLQHAEHYMRIILSAQAQTGQPVIRDDIADNDTDEGDGVEIAGSSMPEPAGSGPQPVIEGTPSEVALTTDLGTGFNIDNEAEPKAERSRRTIRRRMPRKVEADSQIQENTAPYGEDAAEQTEQERPRAPYGEDAAEQTEQERPRRKRRGIKDPENQETPSE